MRPDPAEVQLEPFEDRRHADLLRTWLARPHVSRWWGDPEERSRDVLEPPAGGGHALILAGTEPVGYLRWRRPSQEELAAAGITEIPDGSVDVDILIGEPERLHRGIGPRALRLLLGELAADPTVPLVGLGTSVDNLPAQRAFEKAGFRKRRRFDGGEYGPSWLMTADLSDLRR